MTDIRLIQLHHQEHGRRVAFVNEPLLTLLNASITSTYDLVTKLLAGKTPVQDFVTAHLSSESLAYDPIYQGVSPWKILPAFDHPTNPHACLVSGTGLTHLSSAKNRQMMHLKDTDKLTDSMKIYQWGLDGGSPPQGKIGVQPEWFYKGSGHILKAHSGPLEIPPYADDGGDEAEIAGIYMVNAEGTPIRIGFCNGNEFSDHVMEGKNYLYLAPSKLRHCAIGPELVIGLEFDEFLGSATVTRGEEIIWQKPIKSGGTHMAHSLANLEHHHFKYEAHRIPGQVHIHFYGADSFSYGEHILLEDSDRVTISWEKLGRPLTNTITKTGEVDRLVTPLNIRSL